MVTIPNDILKLSGMTDHEARIEIACRLFEWGKIPMPVATRIAEMSRTQMEGELMKRNIPLVTYTIEMLEEDMRTLEQMREER